MLVRVPGHSANNTRFANTCFADEDHPQLLLHIRHCRDAVVRELELQQVGGDDVKRKRPLFPQSPEMHGLRLGGALGKDVPGRFVACAVDSGLC